MNISDSSFDVTKLALDGSILDMIIFRTMDIWRLNQYDGAIYISSQNGNSSSCYRFNNTTISLLEFTLRHPTTKIIYNPDRKSMWVLQLSFNQIVEIVVELNNDATVIVNSYKLYK